MSNKLNLKSIKPFNALFAIGLRKGYSKEFVEPEEVILKLRAYQAKLIETKEIFLSVSITDCTIVLKDHQEPHLKFEFLNYPRFPMEPATLKKEIIKLAEYMMNEFEQNRIVISFQDETLMLEMSSEVDPGVR